MVSENKIDLFHTFACPPIHETNMRSVTIDFDRKMAPNNQNDRTAAIVVITIVRPVIHPLLKYLTYRWRVLLFAFYIAFNCKLWTINFPGFYFDRNRKAMKWKRKYQSNEINWRSKKNEKQKHLEMHSNCEWMKISEYILRDLSFVLYIYVSHIFVLFQTMNNKQGKFQHVFCHHFVYLRRIFFQLLYSEGQLYFIAVIWMHRQ